MPGGDEAFFMNIYIPIPCVISSLLFVDPLVRQCRRRCVKPYDRNRLREPPGRGFLFYPEAPGPQPCS